MSKIATWNNSDRVVKRDGKYGKTTTISAHMFKLEHPCKFKHKTIKHKKTFHWGTFIFGKGHKR
jgi:hypothetical protein